MLELIFRLFQLGNEMCARIHADINSIEIENKRIDEALSFSYCKSARSCSAIFKEFLIFRVLRTL